MKFRMQWLFIEIFVNQKANSKEYSFLCFNFITSADLNSHRRSDIKLWRYCPDMLRIPQLESSEPTSYQSQDRYLNSNLMSYTVQIGANPSDCNNKVTAFSQIPIRSRRTSGHHIEAHFHPFTLRYAMIQVVAPFQYRRKSRIGESCRRRPQRSCYCQGSICQTSTATPLWKDLRKRILLTAFQFRWSSNHIYGQKSTWARGR